MPRKKVKNQENRSNQDFQDVLTKRIDECESVLKHLEECPAWVVISRDLENNKKFIDDNWQNIPEGDNKLRELRVTKMAYIHLLNLKENYALDLDNAKKELYKIQNPDKAIIKDFDGE